MNGFQYGPSRGYRGGYADPLTRRGPLGTVAAPMSMSAATPVGSEGGFPSNAGDALARILSGAGRSVGGAMDWLTDGEQGENRINAIFGLGTLGAGLYGAHQQGRREDREYRRLEEERGREREREEAVDPVKARILSILMDRHGGAR